MKSREPAANALHAKPVATPDTPSPLTLGCVIALLGDRVQALDEHSSELIAKLAPITNTQPKKEEKPCDHNDGYAAAESVGALLELVHRLDSICGTIAGTTKGVAL